MFHRVRSTVRNLLLLFTLAASSGCFMPESIIESEQTAQKLLSEERISTHFAEHELWRIHYVMRHLESENLVVFIHGTPGSWRIFAPLLHSQQLGQVSTLVAIDRPGWGESSVFEESAILSLERQSAYIGPALQALRDQYQSRNLVLVGHSLGGSLVPRIAMDYPELVDAVVVVAGDLSDQYPAAHWYNKLASWIPFRWLISDTMTRANKEVLSLEADLADMRELWASLEAPLAVIQGQEDGLVDPRHADFAEQLSTASGKVRVFRFADGDHLVHLTHTEQVAGLISQVVLREQSEIFAP